MKNAEFIKFITLEECTISEYKSAKEYVKGANNNERLKFASVGFFIANNVLKEMMRLEVTDYRFFRYIYNNHGLDDEEYANYLSIYINVHMSKDEKERFNNFAERYLSKLAWDECKKVFFSESKLKIPPELDFLTPRNIYDLALYYFKNKMKLNDYQIDVYRNTYKCFWKFVNMKMQRPKDFENAYSFYETYATEEEKESFKKVAFQILSTIDGKTQKEVLAYTKSINISFIHLYWLAKLFGEDMVKKVTSLYNSFWDKCCSVSWSKKRIMEIAKSENITYAYFKEMAILYATINLGIIDIEGTINAIRVGEVKPKVDKNPTIKLILEAEDKNVYFPLIEKIDLQRSDIYAFCYIYFKDRSVDEKERMEENLTIKLQEFSKAKKAATSSSSAYTLDVILDAINSDNTIEEYCKIHGFSETSFKMAIKNAKDPNVLLQYQRKLKEEKQERRRKDRELVLTLVNYLKNGINHNGKIEKFGYIDFFILFPNVNYKGIRAGGLSIYESDLIGSFLLKLNAMQPLIRKSIMSGVFVEIKDGDSSYSRFFNTDELVQIISFIDQFNHPLTNLILQEVCTKYILGTLSEYNAEEFGLK